LPVKLRDAKEKFPAGYQRPVIVQKIELFDAEYMRCELLKSAILHVPVALYEG
jgi:hypothetical protein